MLTGILAGWHLPGQTSGLRLPLPFGSNIMHTVWQGHNRPSVIELEMTSPQREASMYCALVRHWKCS